MSKSPKKTKEGKTTIELQLNNRRLLPGNHSHHQTAEFEREEKLGF